MNKQLLGIECKLTKKRLKTIKLIILGMLLIAMIALSGCQDANVASQNLVKTEIFYLKKIRRRLSQSLYI